MLIITKGEMSFCKHPRRRMCRAVGWLAQPVLMLLQKQLCYFMCEIPRDVLPHIYRIVELAKGALCAGFEMHSFIFMHFLKAKLARSQMWTGITEEWQLCQTLAVNV